VLTTTLEDEELDEVLTEVELDELLDELLEELVDGFVTTQLASKNTNKVERINLIFFIRSPLDRRYSIIIE
jgi:hypothetical protein